MRSIFFLFLCGNMLLQGDFTLCSHRHDNSPTALWAIPCGLIGTALTGISIRCFCRPKKFTPTKKTIQLTQLAPKYLPLKKEKTLLDLGILKEKIAQQKNMPTKTSQCIDTQNAVIKNKKVKISTPKTTAKPKTKTTELPSYSPASAPANNIHDHNNLCWLVSPGFMGKRPQKYSQEAAPESGATQAQHFIDAHIIHGPCVSFNYNDDRRIFNFGQTADIACLKTAFESTQKKDIVLIGTCRGATTALHLITQLPPKQVARIKAVILESPALSLQTVSEQVARSYIGWLPNSPAILHSFFKFWFPSYNPNFPTFLDKFDQIPHDLPILIGQLGNDRVIAEKDILHIANKLKQTGHENIYVVHVTDAKITHARLSRIPAFCQAVNAFLRKHELPHNSQLAQKGESLLNIAQKACSNQ